MLDLSNKRPPKTYSIWGTTELSLRELRKGGGKCPGLTKAANGTRKGLAFLNRSQPPRATTSFAVRTSLHRPQSRLPPTLFPLQIRKTRRAAPANSTFPHSDSVAQNEATETRANPPKTPPALEKRHFPPLSANIFLTKRSHGAHSPREIQGTSLKMTCFTFHVFTFHFPSHLGYLPPSCSV